MLDTTSTRSSSNNNFSTSTSFGASSFASANLSASSFGTAALPSVDKSMNAARELSPKINRPVRMPKAVDAWHRLQRIEHIDVVPVDKSAPLNETVYSVNIYFRRSQSRIPTNNQHLRVTETSSLLASPSSAALSERMSYSDVIPDLQVSYSYSALDTLRHDVWTAVRKYHPVYCELCDALTVKLVTKFSQSPLLTATIHRSRTARAKKMRAFLVHVLGELHDKRSSCVAACQGQNELPVLLYDFLFANDDDAVTRL